MTTTRNRFWLMPFLLVLTFTLVFVGTLTAQQRHLYTGAAGDHAGVQSLTQSSMRSSVPSDPQRRDARYRVQVVDVLPGYEASFLPVLDTINNYGVVAGYCYNGEFGATDDFYLTATPFIGYPKKLRALPLVNDYPGAFAFGLNDNNQVFGVANFFNEECGCVDQVGVWWDHGHPAKVETLSDSIYAYPNAINNWGDMVGTAYGPTNGWIGSPVWWHGGHIAELPLPSGAIGGVATAINDWGAIFGTVFFPEIDHMYGWIPLGKNLVGMDLGSYWGLGGQVNQINMGAQAVGIATTTVPEWRGFLWAWGFLRAIGLPDSTWSELWSINDLGQVLGQGDRADGQWVSFVYQHSVATDLNSLVPAGLPLLNEPAGINNQGVIAVVAFTDDGKTTNFVLTPIH